MFPFQIELMRVEYVLMKKCSLALGGSIQIVDETKSTLTEIKLKRIEIPLAVARRFIKLHARTNFIEPVLTALTYYDDHVVAIEAHPYKNISETTEDQIFGEELWISNSEKNLRFRLDLITKEQNTWYTDGLYVFKINTATTSNYEPLSKDHCFRSIKVLAFNLTKINEDSFSTIELESRYCIQFITDSGQTAISPPIWKNLYAIGMRQFDHEDVEDDAFETEFPFDKIDRILAVNLSFVLNAGNKLVKIFDYDIIEPLQLNELMIRLTTVNLPKVHISIKQTVDTGLNFTHALAWLIGLLDKVSDIQSYMVIRSLLRHLTTKGVYHKNALSPASLYVNPESSEIPLLSPDQLLNK